MQRYRYLASLHTHTHKSKSISRNRATLDRETKPSQVPPSFLRGVNNVYKRQNSSVRPRARKVAGARFPSRVKRNVGKNLRNSNRKRIPPPPPVNDIALRLRIKLTNAPGISPPRQKFNNSCPSSSRILCNHNSNNRDI